MPESRIFLFYDYHEAHLAAHQLQHEGIGAFVFDYTLSTSPWPGYGFRILAIPPSELEEGQEEDEIETDPLEPGVIGSGIDRTLRFLSLAGVCVFPLLVIVILLKVAALQGPRPLVGNEPIAGIALFLAIVTLGGLASARIYQGYRNGSPFCIGVFKVSGVLFAVMQGAWLALLVIALVILGSHGRPARDKDP